MRKKRNSRFDLRVNKESSAGYIMSVNGHHVKGFLTKRPRAKGYTLYGFGKAPKNFTNSTSLKKFYYKLYG